MITHTETIPKSQQALVSLTARLRLPVGADKRPDLTEARMRMDIERFCRPGTPALAVTLEVTGRGRGRNFALTVTAADAESAELELARLAQALVARYPVAEIAWLDAATVLDRITFLDALARPPARPGMPGSASRSDIQRRARRATTARLTGADAQWRHETLVRRLMCEPIPQDETRTLRRELGQLEPRQKIATAALAFSLTLAVNTSGAIAHVLSLF